GQGDADGAQSEAVGVLAAAQGPFAVRLLLGVLDAAVVGADAGGGGPGDLLHRAAQVAQFDAEFPLGDGASRSRVRVCFSMTARESRDRSPAASRAAACSFLCRVGPKYTRAI